MKRALIIAYFFPPDASSGTFRALKFVKYLEQFGWQSIVLTVNPACEPLEPKDEALLAQLPASAIVIRTRAWSFLRRRARGLTQANATVFQETPGARRGGLRFKQTALRARNWFLFPDRWIGWFPFALWHGLTAIRKHKPEIIYTTAPPFTGTLVGLACHAMSGKPLISDFRDPWIGDHYVRDYTPARLRIAGALERTTFKHSARIINVSDELSQQSAQRTPSVARERFLVIPNGFDPEDFARLPARTPNSEFRITYAGSFYPPAREPRNFLLALARLAQTSPAEFREMTACFVGEPQWETDNATWLSGLQLGTHARFIGFRPHREALQMLGESDVLLVIGSIRKSDTGTLTAKLMEYLATKRPILALAHEGELARVVRDSGMGMVANPERPEEIAAVLLQMYHDIRAERFPCQPNADLLNRYDRRAQAQQLAAIFDEVIERA